MEGNIFQDFDLEFRKEDIIARQGKDAERLLNRPRMAENFDQAIKEITEIVTPIGLWGKFPIKGFQHDKIILENGIKIGGGPVVEVMAGAEFLILGVCTIGARVDEKISEIQANKQMVKAIFFDAIASFAAGQLRTQLVSALKLKFAQEGFRTSIALSPGESSWSMNDQAVFFQLLDGQQIGLRVNESMLMIPMKSISFAMAIGKKSLGVETGSRCNYCMMKGKCTEEHFTKI